MNENKRGMLSLYRVLDLTDEKGWLCGKLLGDMGADVIKIEPPGGDPCRKIGPFYKNIPDPEKSLYWFGYNASKRGITLDLNTNGGLETLKKLVKDADFIIESFTPGYLDKLGLGYKDLEKLNPGIIMVSITPFGQTGPYRYYKAPGIVVWALSGHMYSCGNEERPPVQISYHPQAYLNGGAEGAAGAVIALYQRQLTGEGQQVDISIQQTLTQCSWGLFSRWDQDRAIKERVKRNPKIEFLWRCKDGYIVHYFHGHGLYATWYSRKLVNWMDSERMAPDYMKEHNWEEALPISDELLFSMREKVAEFFMTHTRAELFKDGIKWNLTPFPLFTIRDSLESAQLVARKFWVNVEHPELGTSITYPGSLTLSTGLPPMVSRRAPLIGEHNKEIFGKEPWLSKREITPSPDEKSEVPVKRLLNGVKVIEFSNWIAAAQIGKTLALYGAEVIKVEGRTRPDPQRASGRLGPDGTVSLDASVEWNQLNTNKYSIALNLAKPKGIEIAKKIAAWADVLIENYSGEAMEKMGLGYEEIRKINPDIIYLGASMQGHTGPFAASRGVGYHLNALSGFYHLTGWPDREPAGPDGPYPDFFVPRLSILAIMSALDYRRRTGKGQYLDVSQYEASLHFQSPIILDYIINGREAMRVGNRYDYAAPHGAYRCRDNKNWCIIGLSSRENWENLCKSVETETWKLDVKFTSASAEEKKGIEEELNKLVIKWRASQSLEEMRMMLEEWTQSHSVEQVMRLIQPTGAIIERMPSGSYRNNHLHNAYRCLSRDRWCAIAVFTDEEWKFFCKVIGNPRWTEDPKFKTLKTRKENEDELERLIETWTINFSAEEVMAMMQASGVGAGVVQTNEDVMEKDPQLKNRHLFWELEQPVIGKYRGNAPALFLSKADYEVKRAPLLGEHNEYVLKNILGISDEEVVQLVIDGAVE